MKNNGNILETKYSFFKKITLFFVLIMILSNQISIAYALVTSQKKTIQKIHAKREYSCLWGDKFYLDAYSDGDGELSYQVEDNDIIDVDIYGKVTAHKPGNTTLNIYAKETDFFQSASIKVDIHVNKRNYDMNLSNIQMNIHDKYQLKIDTYDDSEFTFQILDPSIASIDTFGNITANKIGRTKIIIAAAATANYHASRKEIDLNVISNLSSPLIKNIQAKNNSLLLQWDKIEGADGYLIYKKDSTKNMTMIADIKSSDTLQYVDYNVKSATNYTYQMKAYAQSKHNISPFSPTYDYCYLSTPVLNVRNSSSNVILSWNQIVGANGYMIYRIDSNDTIKQIATIESDDILSYNDIDAKKNNEYRYMIQAYNKQSYSNLSLRKKIYIPASSDIKSFIKKDNKAIITWSQNENVSGYQIQYATNSLFTDAQSILIDQSNTTSVTIDHLKKHKSYFIRIRTYKNINDITYYSDWKLSKDATKNQSLSLSIVKNILIPLEITSAAKQKVYGYDTMQGGCSDGTYIYYALNNRNVEKCKIVKIRLSDRKVIKVSDVLDIDHGNDMTYNGKTNKIIVVHTRNHKKRISIIDPDTLKIKSNQEIVLSSSMIGVNDKDIKSLKGYAGIGYNESKNQYVLTTKSTGNLVILDSNMKPIRYIKPKKKEKQLLQGIDVTDDYILVGQSPNKNGKYNLIVVYDWDGNYIKTCTIKNKYELENIYHIGNQFYATFYTSYKKTQYQTVTKIKKIAGIKTKIKVREKVTKLKRENYIYQIKEI